MIISVDDFLKLDVKDKVFVIETDTVYGIGCLYDSKEAVNKISSIKNRDASKFYSILVSSFDQVKGLTINSDGAKELTDKYWPGALTIIFEKSDKVKDFVTSNDTVGLRMPDNENTLAILNKFGPMVMTSLNKSGEPPITKFSDALKFENVVDYVIKGKDLSGVPSTVYDYKNKKVLRVGEIKL